MTAFLSILSLCTQVYFYIIIYMSIITPGKEMRHVSEGDDTMPFSSPLHLEKYSKQEPSRYNGKNMKEIGKREEHGCSQPFVLLTGICASKEWRNDAVRKIAITGDGPGASDPIPWDLYTFNLSPLLS